MMERSISEARSGNLRPGKGTIVMNQHAHEHKGSFSGNIMMSSFESSLSQLLLTRRRGPCDSPEYDENRDNDSYSTETERTAATACTNCTLLSSAGCYNSNRQPSNGNSVDSANSKLQQRMPCRTYYPNRSRTRRIVDDLDVVHHGVVHTGTGRLWHSSCRTDPASQIWTA